MSGINRFTASDRGLNFIQDQLSEEDAGLSISGNFAGDSHSLHDYKEEILSRLNYQPLQSLNLVNDLAEAKALLKAAHDQFEHLVKDVTIGVEDNGVVHYEARRGVMYSNFIEAMQRLAPKMRSLLEKKC